MDDERARGGRPRSEQARTAVLHAVDDLLLDIGYASMTMKGIAERAGVSRMTVYRWWSTKAEILFEASVIDARQELAIAPSDDALTDVTTYLEALERFLTSSPAGAAYRALLGEAQHDPAVAQLIGARDVVAESARTVIATAGIVARRTPAALDRAAAELVGPTFFWVLSGRDPRRLARRELAEAFLDRARATR